MSDQQARTSDNAGNVQHQGVIDAEGGQDSPGFSPPMINTTPTMMTPPNTTDETPNAAAPPLAPTSPDADPSGNASNTVLTPSRLRLDARVLLTHTTLTWLFGYCFFVVLLLFKLKGGAYSWPTTFIPLYFAGAASIFLHTFLLTRRKYFILQQLGPPPPIIASARIHLQYSWMLETRSRSHVIDCINNIIEATALIATEAALAYGFQSGRLQSGRIALRLLFTPIWVAWPVTTVISCLKHRSERSLGSMREFLFVFCLFIACEVDGISTWSWSVAFIVLWVWFCGLFLVCFGVMVLLLSARFWTRLSELSLPIGFFLLLTSTTPQFASYVYLVDLLQSLKDNNLADLDIQRSISYICVPNAMSWGIMWLSSLIIFYGLRQKELLRGRLLAANQVWTLNEQVARALRGDGEGERTRVDQMSPEEVQRMVDEMMAQRNKPTRLLRIGTSLYKRLIEDEGGPSANEPSPPSPSPSRTNQNKLPASSSLERDLELGVIKTNQEANPATPRREVEGQQRATTTTIQVPRPPSVSSTAAGHAPGLSLELSLSSVAGIASIDGGGGGGGGGGGRLPIMNNNRRVAPLIDEQGRSSASSLVEVLRAAASTSSHRNREPTPPATPAAPTAPPQADENLCVICYDAEPTCILLAAPDGSSGPCGHGGFCKRCANLLYVRLPAECPVCRAPIDQVVELESQPPIGCSSPVKN